MTNNKLSRLLALVDREFRGHRRAPVRAKFKGLKVNLTALDEWERQRGAAVRLTGVVLRQDSDTLLQRISSDPETASAYAQALPWLRKEASVLRKAAGRMDLAVYRLSAVLATHERAGTEARLAGTTGGATP